MGIWKTLIKWAKINQMLKAAFQRCIPYQETYFEIFKQIYLVVSPKPWTQNFIF